MFAEHPVLHEALEQWPAWTVLVADLTRSDPLAACPQSLFGAACAVEPLDRLASLLYGKGCGESLGEAAALLGEVLAMAQTGRRPRCPRECGLLPDSLFRIGPDDFDDLGGMAA